MFGVIRRLSRRVSFPLWTAPIAMLGLCALSYGILLPRLGLYWDDWFITWYVHFLKPSIFVEVFTEDRPLLGWLYVLTTSLVGEAPLAWHVFGLFTRWLSCLALYWALRGLWPGKSVQIIAVTFLFAVYPGFSQQYIPISYSHHLIVLTLTLISLGAMNWALRFPKWFWSFFVVSLVVSGTAMFTMEYYFGLEMLRPVFLWLILSEERISEARWRLKRFGLYWAPYVLLNALFLAWRISTPTPRGDVNILDRLGADPLTAALELLGTVFQDLFKVSALAWGKVLDITGIASYSSVTILKYTLIVLGVAAFSILYLQFVQTGRQSEVFASLRSRRRWALLATFLGLYALLVAGLPFWMTGLRIMLSFTRDRFTLPMMLGTSLLLVGLIELLAHSRLQSVLFVGVLVGLGAGLHFQTALTYHKEWMLQKDFFWQLTWRAPGLQPGTVVLTSDVPFVYDSDNSLTAPLNWMYVPENASRELPYQLYNVESHLTRGLPDLEEGMRIYQGNRLTPFDGSVDQAIVVFYRPPACLKVVDPRTDQRLPDKPRYFRELLPFSKPELILPETDLPAQPPAYFFGQEPEHEWCYYFQKAELARQVGDWQKVAEIGDLTLVGKKEFYRRNVAELMPFIEGYAYTGRWDEALGLSLQAYQTWENMQLSLCDLWQRVLQTDPLDADGQGAFKQIQGLLRCAAP